MKDLSFKGYYFIIDIVYRMVFSNDTIFLFDVDGTLAESCQMIDDTMIAYLTKLSKYGLLGIVGGGTIDKIRSQIEPCLDLFKYIFAESGGSVYCDGILFHQNHIRLHPSYKSIDKLKKHSLKYIASQEYDLVGTFIDQREGLIYISLIGIQANLDERNYFMNLDNIHKYRETLLNQLNEMNDDPNIEINYGGAVGLGIAPKEWNKSQVLQYISYKNIYYFGDRYLPNGNDYPLLTHPKVIGIAVDNPNDTILQIDKIIHLVSNESSNGTSSP
jgi:phosphomannomutase